MSDPAMWPGIEEEWRKRIRGDMDVRWEPGNEDIPFTEDISLLALEERKAAGTAITPQEWRGTIGDEEVDRRHPPRFGTQEAAYDRVNYHVIWLTEKHKGKKIVVRTWPRVTPHSDFDTGTTWWQVYFRYGIGA